ncbi:MAG: hypothetical protein SXQ77_05440 [Halobacteria archaeon]|nr:hypothetical protein [Halobacteria archaeon]
MPLSMVDAVLLAGHVILFSLLVYVSFVAWKAYRSKRLSYARNFFVSFVLLTVGISFDDFLRYAVQTNDIIVELTELVPLLLGVAVFVFALQQ